MFRRMFIFCLAFGSATLIGREIDDLEAVFVTKHVTMSMRLANFIKAGREVAISYDNLKAVSPSLEIWQAAIIQALVKEGSILDPANKNARHDDKTAEIESILRIIEFTYKNDLRALTQVDKVFDGLRTEIVQQVLALGAASLTSPTSLTVSLEEIFNQGNDPESKLRGLKDRYQRHTSAILSTPRMEGSADVHAVVKMALSLKTSAEVAMRCEDLVEDAQRLLEPLDDMQAERQSYQETAEALKKQFRERKSHVSP